MPCKVEHAEGSYIRFHATPTTNQKPESEQDPQQFHFLSWSAAKRPGLAMSLIHLLSPWSEPGPDAVGFAPLNGPGRTRCRARRAAAAQVALARLVRARQREDGAERTCDGAKMAADAEVAEYYFRLRHRING